MIRRPGRSGNHRIATALLPVLLVFGACTGGAGQPSAGSTTQPPPTSTPQPGTTGPGAGATPGPTGPTPTSAGTAARATGSGTIRVDGVEHPLEVAVCGWADVGDTLQDDPGRQRLFRVVTAHSVGSGGISFALDWYGSALTIDMSVLLFDPTDPDGAFAYFNDRESIDHVEISVGRVRSLTALAVYDGQNIQTATRHEVEFELECETFGGTIQGAPAVVAEIVGLPMPEPAVGSVTIDGQRIEVATTTCRTSPSQTEVEAVSADGTVYILVLSTSSSGKLLIYHGSTVLDRTGSISVEVGAGFVRSTGPITVPAIGGEEAEVEFQLACG